MRIQFIGTNRAVPLIAAAAAVALFQASAPARVQAGPTEKQGPRVIRWVVAHDRGNTPFSDLNRSFAQRLHDKSGGKLKVEFVKSDASDSQVDDAAYLEVSQGKADMSQLAATAARVRVFDMPFLFRSYEHADAVFTGPVGQKLVAGISASSGGQIRGFGFTYSGGYRVLAGRTAVRRLSDFKGVRMRRGVSHLAPFMQQLGVSLVEAGAASRERPIDDIAAGKVDLEETEVNRLALVQREHPEILGQIDYVNLTHHRMYVTAIVANEKFYASLPADQQRLLSEEMETLAAAERKLSIDLEKRNRELLAKKGVRFVDLAGTERRDFAKAAEAYRHAVPELEGLVQEIQAVKDSPKLALK